MPTIKRAFKNMPVAICFSANESFADYLCVMLQSVIDKSHTDNLYDIVLLASSMSNEKSQMMKSLFSELDNFSFRIFDSSSLLSQYDLFTGDAQNTGRLSVDTYTRLAIPELFQDYERVLYLDGDMITNIDVAEFYKIDFENNQLISSRDLWGTCNCYIDDDPLREYREKIVGMDNVDDYFIGGMIIFNMETIRPEVSKELFDLASEQNWKHHDQDVMNKYFQHKTKLIDASWDYLSDKYNSIQYLPPSLQDEFLQAQKNPKIIHFGGSRKPWKASYQENDILFWETAYKTPVFWTVLNQRPWGLEYKSYVLEKLKACFPEKIIKKNNLKFKIHGKYVGAFNSRNVHLEFCELRGSLLVVEGFIPLFGLSGNETVKVLARCGKHVFQPVKNTHDDIRYLKQNQIRYKIAPFKFVIRAEAMDQGSILGFICQIDGTSIPMKNILHSKHCAVSPRYVNSYQYSNGFILKPAPKGVTVDPASEEARTTQENKLLEELSSDPNFETIKRLRNKALNYAPTDNRQIWLFSDRTNKADDNAEAMFKYVTENHSDTVEAFFVLRRDSSDYERISKIGNVVPYLSESHKLLHLLCDCNLSSQADQPVFLPFDNIQAFCGLLRKQKYIFLQHGVIKNDISRWFNRPNIDPFIFVTSSKQELESIVNTPRYSLDRSIVKLTGLPRHDRLYSSDEKMVTIMPTWRIGLCERKPEDQGVWHTKPNFKNSDYCLFFSSVLNNQKLKAACDEFGYSIAFMPHPNIAQSINDFALPKYVKTLGTDSSYREVFAKSSLVITDYSSSVMDFAYLRKPIIYTHFDYDDFFSGVHIASKGYFDDKKDGFGPVTYSVDSLVDEIVKSLRKGCQMDAVYKNRADSFFAFNDKNNCSRVFKSIREKSARDTIGENVSNCSMVESSLIDPPRPFEDTLSSYTKVSKTKLSNAISDLNLQKRNTSWKRSLTNTLPVFIQEEGHPPSIIPYKEFVSKKWASPDLSQFKDIDKKAQYVAYFASKVGKSIPYRSPNWSKKIEDKYIGAGWRPFDPSKTKTLCRGDVICFKNGTIALVLENNKGKYTFTYSRLFRGYHRILRGGLGTKKQPSTFDELPSIKWALRRIV